MRWRTRRREGHSPVIHEPRVIVRTPKTECKMYDRDQMKAEIAYLLEELALLFSRRASYRTQQETALEARRMRSEIRALEHCLRL
jgi:hypothetical protein